MDEQVEKMLIQYWVGKRDKKDLMLLKARLAWIESKDITSAEFLVMRELLVGNLIKFCVSESGKLSLSLNENAVKILKDRIAYLEGRENG